MSKSKKSSDRHDETAPKRVSRRRSIESHDQFIGRLALEGRTEAFYQRRDELKNQGMDGSAAWQLAKLEFGPLGDDETGDDSGGGVRPTAGSGESSGPVAEHGVSASVFEGKSATEREAVRWVAQNLAICDVRPEDAPSAEAWALLSWSQSSPSNQSEFWRQIYVKAMPSRSAEDGQAEKMKDDGRHILDVLDEIERILDEQEVEEARGEGDSEA